MKRFGGKFSITMVLGLTGLWLWLNQSFAPAQLALGLLVSILLAWFGSTLRRLQANLHRADVALALLFRVAVDIVRSNFNVARIVLGRSVRSGMLNIPLELRDPHGLAALAAIITSTPGTVWIGLSADGNTLTLHVLDLHDEEGLIELIKRRYELPLMKIFQ
jgi:multicomponent K+:H+ antiporter subunit E